MIGEPREGMPVAETPQSASVLPAGHSAKTPEGLIQEGLLGRLAELERLVGAEALRSTSLGKPELLEIATRLDKALEGVTGVSARDRTLAWLHDAVVEVGREMKGDLFVPGAQVNLPLHVLLWFFVGETHQFPRLRGSKKVKLPDGSTVRVTESRFVGPALGAAAMAQQPGRRRGKRWRTPDKWTAFRNLAVAEGLVGSIEPHDLKRVVMSAKARLGKVGPPVPMG